MQGKSLRRLSSAPFDDETCREYFARWGDETMIRFKVNGVDRSFDGDLEIKTKQ
jgi:hypothetical protein